MKGHSVNKMMVAMQREAKKHFRRGLVERCNVRSRKETGVASGSLISWEENGRLHLVT